MAVRATFRVLLDSWTFDPGAFDEGAFATGEELTDDVELSHGLRAFIGIRGSGPREAVAGPGEFTFALDNSHRNSAATEGYYSPQHPSCRPLWGRDAWVTLLASYDGNDRRLFTGRVGMIDPVAGENRQRSVFVTAYDVMQGLIEESVREVDVQIGQTDVAIVNTILDAIPVEKQPLGRSFDASTDEYPYVLNDIGDGAPVVGLLNDLAISGLMLMYANGEGVIVTKNRITRALASSGLSLGDEDLLDIAVPSTRANVFDVVRTYIEPPTVDAEPIWRLFTQEAVTRIEPGETIEVWDAYRDQEDPQTSIAGIDPQPIVSGTDYVANSAADGTGMNYTSALVISVTPFATSAKTVMTNTASAPLFVTVRQLRGKRVRMLSRQWFQAGEGGSGKALELLLPYQDDPTIASVIATYLQSAYAGDAQAESATFNANTSHALMVQAMTRQIGDRVELTEAVTGLSGLEVEIRSELHEISHGDIWDVTYGVAPASPLNFGLWDVVGRSEWDPGFLWGF